MCLGGDLDGVKIELDQSSKQLFVFYQPIKWHQAAEITAAGTRAMAAPLSVPGLFTRGERALGAILMARQTHARLGPR